MHYANINDITAAFIDMGCECKTQLRYLLYYYKAWGLAVYDINIPEDILSHMHGPMFKSYHDKWLKYDTVEEIRDSLYGYGELTSAEAELLEQVYITYGDRSYNELACLSKGEAPWIAARLRHGDDNSLIGDIIDEEHMEQYYRDRYRGRQ